MFQVPNAARNRFDKFCSPFFYHLLRKKVDAVTYHDEEDSRSLEDPVVVEERVPLAAVRVARVVVLLRELRHGPGQGQGHGDHWEEREIGTLRCTFCWVRHAYFLCKGCSTDKSARAEDGCENIIFHFHIKPIIICLFIT